MGKTIEIIYLIWLGKPKEEGINIAGGSYVCLVWISSREKKLTLNDTMTPTNYNNPFSQTNKQTLNVSLLYKTF